jgi:hypothetical protein
VWIDDGGLIRRFVAVGPSGDSSSSDYGTTVTIRSTGTITSGG